MKQALLFIFFILSIFTRMSLQSQTLVCNKDTAFNITFGDGNSGNINLSFLRNYLLERGSCPPDGYYSFTPSTYDCFDGTWLSIPEDHTPGDVGGRMMLVNASVEPGDFFVVNGNGLPVNTTYELSAWLLNVCEFTIGCKTLFPEIEFIVTGPDSRLLARFNTGIIAPERTPAWRKYSFTFTTPSQPGLVTFKIADRSEGGCGNDFAIDDIVVTRCDTIKKEPIKPALKPVTKPVEKPKPIIPKPVKKDTQLITRSNPVIIPPVMKPVIKDPGKITMPVPLVLQTRTNPVVKQILTDSAELLVELYDNGVIDGDTVSIYHNNELVIANKVLSAKPIRLVIRVDAQHSHHELVMVANNLGAIPPNTSLMIVTANDKRYEVFISSDDKKNARVMIDLKK
jgi:hypothetical protein